MQKGRKLIVTKLSSNTTLSSTGKLNSLSKDKLDVANNLLTYTLLCNSSLVG